MLVRINMCFSRINFYRPIVDILFFIILNSFREAIIICNIFQGVVIIGNTLVSNFQVCFVINTQFLSFVIYQRSVVKKRRKMDCYTLFSVIVLVKNYRFILFINDVILILFFSIY